MPFAGSLFSLFYSFLFIYFSLKFVYSPISLQSIFFTLHTSPFIFMFTITSFAHFHTALCVHFFFPDSLLVSCSTLYTLPSFLFRPMSVHSLLSTINFSHILFLSFLFHPVLLCFHKTHILLQFQEENILVCSISLRIFSRWPPQIPNMRITDSQNIFGQSRIVRSPSSLRIKDRD